MKYSPNLRNIRTPLIIDSMELIQLDSERDELVNSDIIDINPKYDHVNLS